MILARRFTERFVSISTLTPPSGIIAPPGHEAPRRPDIFVSDNIVVPGWIVDLESFRRWATSGNYPPSGWVSFLNGAIFVDPHIEELFTHNQVKGAYAYAIMSVLGPNPNGLFVHDRMLLTNPSANLSTEPDGLFFFWTTIQSNRLRMVEGADGFIELTGTADMVLEVVSKHSVPKDTVALRELYWKAGIAEYWLVDARGVEPRFEILRHAETDYAAVEPVTGWVASSVFGRRFQIVKKTNPLGQPQFVVLHDEMASQGGSHTTP
jgi:Uma2 family endonuclease